MMLPRFLRNSPLKATLLAAAIVACSSADPTSLPEPHVMALQVNPTGVELFAGDTLQLTASAQYSDGSTAPVAVQWSATGAAIAPDGRLIVSDEGQIVVTALLSRSDVSGNGTFSVRQRTPGGPSGPKVVALILTPDEGQLQIGEALQFTAVGQLKNGGTTVLAVDFSSSGGSITASGLYTAPNTAGTYIVVARRSDGNLADTSVVTVTDPPPTDPPPTEPPPTEPPPTEPPPTEPPPTDPPAVVNECATPQAGWIFCDDFEENRLSSYFEVDNAGGRFTRAEAVGHESSFGMRARFEAGSVGAGSLKLAFGRTPQSYFRPVDAGTTNYRELYWRLYLRNQADWTGGGGDKLSRATIFGSSSSWAQAMIAHVWSGGNGSTHLVIDPASGTNTQGVMQTTTYNDFPNLRWLGSAASTTPVFAAPHIGHWQCIETRVKLNDAGQSNGIFELRINGTLEAARTGLNWVGDYSAYGINAVFIENYWNSGSPVAQERYLDRIVVSTQPIGC